MQGHPRIFQSRRSDARLARWPMGPEIRGAPVSSLRLATITSGNRLSHVPEPAQGQRIARCHGDRGIPVPLLHSRISSEYRFRFGSLFQLPLSVNGPAGLATRPIGHGHRAVGRPKGRSGGNADDPAERGDALEVLGVVRIEDAVDPRDASQWRRVDGSAVGGRLVLPQWGVKRAPSARLVSR